MHKTQEEFFQGEHKANAGLLLGSWGFSQGKDGLLPNNLVVHGANCASILLQITEVLSEDDSDVWKAKKWKNQGYCYVKEIGRTLDTMEFRSKTDQLIDLADNIMAAKKKENNEEEDEARD